FIQCAQTTGHNYEALSIFDKHYFSDKEKTVIQNLVPVNIWIVSRFERKVNIQPNRCPPTFHSSFVPGFHNPRAASRNYSVSGLCQSFGDISSELIIRMIGLCPG